ncbi:MAG TPA: hypothetical protein VGA29_08855 [Ignavibacteriaceae bacterium]
MEKLSKNEETVLGNGILPANVVVTGNIESRIISEKLSEEGNTVSFIHLDESVNLGNKNIAFKEMHPAINLANQQGSDLVIGVDVTSDKLSLAVRKSLKGAFQLLNAHQLAVLLTYIWINDHVGEELILIKSSQISEMVDKMADKERIEYLTRVIESGKLGEVIEEVSTSRKDAVVAGFTENQEFYQAGKDLVCIVKRLVEMEMKLRSENNTLYDKLVELYQQHGYYKEKTFAVDFTDDAHRKHLLDAMAGIRKNPAFIKERLNVLRVTDYYKGKVKNLISQNITTIDQSGYNILKLDMENGTSLTFVPAEDKMYYYLGIKEVFRDKESMIEVNRNFDEHALHIMQIINKL